MDWPKYSPDLNPIKMIWKRIKNMVAAKHSELATIKGSGGAIKDVVVAAVIEAWDKLDEGWLWRLTANMVPSRQSSVCSPWRVHTLLELLFAPICSYSELKTPRIGGDIYTYRGPWTRFFPSASS